MPKICQVKLNFFLPFGDQKNTIQINVWTKVNLDSLSVFGCTAHVQIENLSGLHKNGIFLGSSDNSRTYLKGISDEKNTFIDKKFRNVTFIEQKILNNNSLSSGQTQLEQEEDLNPVSFICELLYSNVIPKLTEETKNTKIDMKQCKMSTIY